MMAGRKWKCWEDREGRVSTKRPFVGQGNPPPVSYSYQNDNKGDENDENAAKPKRKPSLSTPCPHCVDHQYLIALQLINILSRGWNFQFNQTQIFEWDIWSDQKAFSNCHVWEKKSDTGFTPMSVFCHLKRYYFILILLFSYLDNLVIETLREYKTGLNSQISTPKLVLGDENDCCRCLCCCYLCCLLSLLSLLLLSLLSFLPSVTF